MEVEPTVVDPTVDDTPADAYRSFLTAVRKDKSERALELLASPTRQALTTRAQALSAASGGSLSADPAALLVGPAHPPAPTDVSVRFEDGKTAVLAVSTAGSTSEVHLRREAGHWRVSIPALEKSGNG